MKSVFVTERISIPESELKERFIQSSGPGGQNVNKVASAVQLSFDVSRSAVLPEAVRRRVLELAGRQVSKEGVVLITARRFREQERNRTDARDRLAALIREAAEPPKPRYATRVPRAQKKQRLEGKKRTAAIKHNRGRPRGDDPA